MFSVNKHGVIIHGDRAAAAADRYKSSGFKRPDDYSNLANTYKFVFVVTDLEKKGEGKGLYVGTYEHPYLIFVENEARVWDTVKALAQLLGSYVLDKGKKLKNDDNRYDLDRSCQKAVVYIYNDIKDYRNTAKFVEKLKAKK